MQIVVIEELPCLLESTCGTLASLSEVKNETVEMPIMLEIFNQSSVWILGSALSKNIL
jgi:hypothetical protein